MHLFSSLVDVLPDPKDLARMSASDLAWFMLCVWPAVERRENPIGLGEFCRYHFRRDQVSFPDSSRLEVEAAISEAWAWLEGQGLLVPDLRYGAAFGAKVRSRAALALVSEADWANLKMARLLPSDLLHQRIKGRIWSTWARGDFSAAVFQAFKEVEMSVRKAALLQSTNDNLGVRLMRGAFHTKNGPLTDLSAEEGERQALGDLFAGAIGSYKNPHSHREVEISAEEAAEMIILASHLVKIAEARGSTFPDD